MTDARHLHQERVAWYQQHRMDDLHATPRPSPERPSGQTLTPAVWIGFTLAMLFVVACGYAALYELRYAFRAGDSMRAALWATAQSGRLREALDSAENAQRSHLLTGEDVDLQQYERHVATVRDLVAQLRTLANDDATLRDELASLEPMLATRLDELRRIAELRRAADHAAARAPADPASAERIATALASIETHASQRLDAFMETREARRQRARWMIAATAGGAVLAITLSLLLLARSIAAGRRTEERAHESEERLRTMLSTQLADSERRARVVLDTTVSAIVSIDAQGRVETFNQAAERMFGYTADDIRGRSVNLLMPPPYRDEHDRYIRRYLETGERTVIGIGREVTGLRRDGTTFPMALAVADTVVDGQHVFTGIITDLTREKEAEDRERRLLKQARQNERLADVGAMTARIAHDFGNPLAGLHMAAQRVQRLLGRDPIPIDRTREAVDTIIATTRRLDTLVGEFKEFAREQRLQLRDIDLPAFLRQVVTTWKGEAEARGIALELAAGTPLTLRGDEEKLRRVMDNLVKNAFEAIERGPGFVRLAAEAQEPDRVQISVTDSGPGIPDGTDVFALFETTKSGGTGLGLPICKQIILAHGGGIKFARRPPSGTVFSIELPRHGPTYQL